MKERLKDLAIGSPLLLLLLAFPRVAAYPLCSIFAGCFRLLADCAKEDCDKELDGGPR